MARPRKNVVEYFPHDAKASRNSYTIEALENIIGSSGEMLNNDGYAFWFRLLEMLCCSENQVIDMKDNIQAERLYARMKMQKVDTDKCLDVCVRQGAIDGDLFRSEKIIRCEKLCENVQGAFKKRCDSLSRVARETATKPIEGVRTAFGEVKIDKGWARIEKVYSEQIGDLPMGRWLEELQDFYDAFGGNDAAADIIELALIETNKKHPSSAPPYIRAILSNWQKLGIKTKEQAVGKMTERKAKTQDQPQEEDVKWL